MELLLILKLLGLWFFVIITRTLFAEFICWLLRHTHEYDAAWQLRSTVADIGFILLLVGIYIRQEISGLRAAVLETKKSQ